MKRIFLVFLINLNVALVNAGAVHISAFIDGKSELIIENNLMFWHHSDFAAPGRWNGNDFPTIVNGVDWLPTWPQSGRNDFCNCYSSTIAGLIPVLSNLKDFSVNVKTGRGLVSLLDTPSKGNNYRMEIEFDDNPFGGAAWYDIEIFYSRVPETQTIFLFLVGLLGFMFRQSS